MNQQFELKYKIGSGGFGEVYLAIDKNDGKIVAVKVMKNLEQNGTNQNEFENKQREFEQEIRIISQIDNPLILKYLWSGKLLHNQEERFSMVTKYYPNGNLKDVLMLNDEQKKIIGWDDTKQLIVIYMIAASMAYLHKKGIIHRDLKPANILMDEYFNPIIADFGLAKIANSELIELSRRCGTLGYMSPEIISDTSYTKSVDVYSFGFILYDIIVNKPIYEGYYSARELCNDILNGKRPNIPTNTPIQYKKLIIKCWSNNASNRFTFEGILEHLKSSEFLKDIQSSKKINTDDFGFCIQYTNQFLNNDGNNEILPFSSFIIEKSMHFRPLKAFDIKNDTNHHIDYYAEGVKYEFGIEGCECNPQKAAELFKQGSDIGDIDCMRQYADMLFYGNGIEANKKEAINYFKKASFKGNSASMYQIYLLYKQTQDEEDIGITEEEAYMYLQMAANKEDFNAINDYALKLYILW